MRLFNDVKHEADRIAREASSIGAGRVVFRTQADQVYTNADAIDLAEALRDPGIYKYKIQRWQQNKWTDIKKYQRLHTRVSVSKAAEITDIIGSGRFKSLADVPTLDIVNAIQAEPKRYRFALRKLQRSVYHELAKHKESTTLIAAADFLAQINREISVPLSLFLGISFNLQLSVESEDLANIHQTGRQEAMLSKMMDEAEPYLDCGSSPSRMAATGMLGKIASLSDRTTAASYFRTMLGADPQNLLDNFHLEEGTYTYFESSELTDEGGRIAAEVRNSIRPLHIVKTQNSLGVVVAMDPSFFRVYGPQLFFYAQQLPEVDFNILLCGAAEDVEYLVADGRQFQKSLERLNRTGAPKNVNYYRVPIPPFVRNKQTFYASARFFSPDRLLERYQSLYLMDADLSTDSDPRPYFKKVSDLSFAAPRMPGLPALYPWRRYMAGNVVMNRRLLGSRLLEDLQKYLVHGLQFKKNWTLDQNALAYTIERHPALYTDLSAFDRPFYQNKFRIAWERHYLEVNKGN